jgi:hypothetical protein
VPVPAETLRLDGAAEIVKFAGPMTSVTCWLWTNEASVPVIVSWDVPNEAPDGIVTVSVAPLPASMAALSNDAVTPDGSPLTDRLTVPGVPTTVVEIAYVPLVPGAIVFEAGVTSSVKSVSGQVPQSAGQVAHVSPDQNSHTLSPHPDGQVSPQVCATSQTQVESHVFSQQYESTSQILRTQESHVWASAAPCVQIGCVQEQTPQSSGQVHADSLESQVPLPQSITQVPQSDGQVAQLSPL